MGEAPPRRWSFPEQRVSVNNRAGLVESYLLLGLRIGRHIDGLVDAYYGPAALASSVDGGTRPGSRTARGDGPRAARCHRRRRAARRGRSATAEEHGAAAHRRHWLHAQARGLLTTARKLAGEPVSLRGRGRGLLRGASLSCRRGGLRRRPPTTRRGAARLGPARRASGRLARVARGTGRQAAPAPSTRWPRTCASGPARSFGLPDGEHVEFELVTDRPWAGFNYYLGDLHSRVAVNTDLPVLSIGLAHLVAHESYPGHHTEHTRKEVGLVRRRHWWEESIFLVGTPQCLLAEGLADLGLEVVMGRRPEQKVADHLRPLGIRYDAEVVAAVSEAGEALGAVRQNAAFRLHEDGADPDTVDRRGGPVGAAADRAGGEGRRVPHPPDLARLPHLLRRGPAPLPRLRRAVTRPGSTVCSPSS